LGYLEKNKAALWISKILFSDITNSFLDIQNNYFGYPKNGINVNSACHRPQPMHNRYTDALTSVCVIFPVSNKKPETCW